MKTRPHTGAPRGMRVFYERVIYYCFLLLTIFFSVTPAAAFPDAPHRQLSGIVDLRTDFSDGKYNLESLIRLAREKGFRLLIINDHDRVALEYGLPPFRNILKKKVELNSINKEGAEKYLRAIDESAKNHPEMIVIPGSETTSFYYWSGSPLKDNLTAHDHERRLLTIGMENPEDYRDLPILHNSSFPKLTFSPMPAIIFLCLSLVAAYIAARSKRRLRITALVFFMVFLAFALNSRPYRTSPFDPYHGKQGIAPYQLVIDYVASKKGMTFWNYPETKSGVRKMGPIRVSTLPYPEMLLETRGYTGFAALYGDNITVTEPGEVWDVTLKEYCRGFRERPPWGIATSDFHGEGEDGENLGNFQTVFFIRKRTKEEVLKAMREGKMYACRVKYPQTVKLDEFSVSSANGGARGISGDEISLKGSPRIKISLSAGKDPTAREVTVRLIRSGELINVFKGKLPFKIDYEDEYRRPGETIYYRMDMKGYGTIISNPIFVKFPGGTP